MTHIAAETAWNVLPVIMTFLTIYCTYHLIKDKKRKVKDKKIKPVHRNAIIFGLVVGWLVALYAILSRFVIVNNETFTLAGIFICLFFVYGLLITLRLLGPKHEKGSPPDMAFKGTFVLLGVTILIIIYGLFFK